MCEKTRISCRWKEDDDKRNGGKVLEVDRLLGWGLRQWKLKAWKLH